MSTRGATAAKMSSAATPTSTRTAPPASACSATSARSRPRPRRRPVWSGSPPGPPATSIPTDTRTSTRPPTLPTICGHRDVLDETCPGDGLYSQLDTIRDQVAEVLSGADPTITAEFYPGDTVQVIVDDANLRSGPGTDSDTLTTLPWGTVLTVTDGATTSEGYAWYGVSGDYGWGYCAGVVLQRIAEGMSPATASRSTTRWSSRPTCSTCAPIPAAARRSSPPCPTAPPASSPTDRSAPTASSGTRSRPIMGPAGRSGSISRRAARVSSSRSATRSWSTPTRSCCGAVPAGPIATWSPSRAARS